MSSDSSMSNDEQKTGYELTDFMKEFNAKTKIDYTDGYDPKSCDEHYKNTNPLWEKEATDMPNQYGFTFDILKSHIKIDQKLFDEASDCLNKFQDHDTHLMKPLDIKKKFEAVGLDKENKAIYSCVSWICEANLYSGTEYMTFEEYIHYAGYFFSQRHLEEGLKYMFMLLDSKHQGYLLKNEFNNVCAQNNINLSNE
jgi:Ca2+-binding EF-hand superfamily protein